MTSSAAAEGPRDALCYVENSCYVSRGMRLERFQTAKVAFKAIQGHWQWCHLIGHMQFPVSVPLQLRLYLAPLTRYYQYITYFPKSKEAM